MARFHGQTMDMAEGECSLTIEGNRLTLIPDGPDRFRELMRLIDGAKTSLRLLYYIYTADKSGAAVRDGLLRAMDRGVDVALLIDGFGSSHAGRPPTRGEKWLLSTWIRADRYPPRLAW